MKEQIKKSYSIQVWNGKIYTDWGISYNNKDKAIKVFTDYMATTKRMGEGGYTSKLGGIAEPSEHYKNEHIIYMSKPYKVKETIVKMQWTEEINIEEYQYKD